MNTENPAIRTLSLAFSEDPLFAWVLPQRSRRVQDLTAVFSGALRHCARVGGVARVSDGNGVALWSAGERMRIGLWDALWSGAMTLPFRIGWASMMRLDRSEVEAERFVHASVGRPFAYVMAVAVDPSHQGMGLGRAVLQRTERDAFAAGHRTLALKTENRANVPLYKKLGFRVCGRITYRASGLPMWTLAKEVRP